MKKEDHPTYSFYRTNPAMDIAAKKFLEIKYLIYELAEIENAVYKIAMEIKKPAKGLMHWIRYRFHDMKKQSNISKMY